MVLNAFCKGNGLGASSCDSVAREVEQSALNGMSFRRAICSTRLLNVELKKRALADGTIHVYFRCLKTH